MPISYDQAVQSLTAEENTEENRQMLSEAGEDVGSVLRGIKALSEADLLGYADIRAEILTACKGDCAESISHGLLKLGEARLLNRTELRASVIQSQDFAGIAGWLLAELSYSHLLDREDIRVQLFNSCRCEHPNYVIFGIMALRQAGALGRDDLRAHVLEVCQGEHAESISRALIALSGANQLENDAIRNQVIAAGADARNLARWFIRRRPAEDLDLYEVRTRDPDPETQSAEQVIEASKNINQFYLLPNDRHGYDTARMENDFAHSGPQIRKMSYLYRYLQDNKFIPNTEHDIISTIQRLVAYANDLDEDTFSSFLPSDSRRMFKIGIDRMLRSNERITSTQDWNSRALILGVFRCREELEAKRDIHPDDFLKHFNEAFIMGVRQVIEAAGTDGECHDPVCLTAATKGFFANSSVREAGSNEVADLTGVYPHCHGRLKNLSIELASLLGYPATLGGELEHVLSNMSDECHAQLRVKLDAVDITAAESFKITEPALYAAGVDNNIFASLVQVYAVDAKDMRPSDVTDKQASNIRDLLAPRVSVKPPKPI